MNNTLILKVGHGYVIFASREAALSETQCREAFGKFNVSVAFVYVDGPVSAVEGKD
jgi:hypothetical protein